MTNNNQHLPGKPISMSTYTNHRCRCDGCTEAWRLYARERPTHQITSLIQRKCRDLVRDTLPDVYEDIRAEAHAELRAAQR